MLAVPYFSEVANDYVQHVDGTGGDDANSGKTFALAVETIGQAVTNVPNGGIIIIYPGTYAEFVDLNTANKDVVLAGLDPGQCIIQPAADSDGIKVNLVGATDGYPDLGGTIIQNLTVKTTGTGHKSVDAAGARFLQVINCRIEAHDDSMDALYIPASYCKIERCYIYGTYDVLYMSDGVVKDCIIIGDGLSSNASAHTYGIKCGGGGFATQLRSKGGVLIENTKIIMNPTIFEGAPAKVTADYAVTQDYTGIANTGPLRLVNCEIQVKSVDAEDGTSTGDAIAVKSSQGLLLVNNCDIYAEANNAVASATAIDCDDMNISNSNIYSSGVVASRDINAIGDVNLRATTYDALKTTVGGSFDPGALADSNGRVDISKINGNTDSVTRLDKATKLLTNKAVQNKNTGAIDYYDDDGQTILFTHTPIDDESTITRTPS